MPSQPASASARWNSCGKPPSRSLRQPVVVAEACAQIRSEVEARISCWAGVRSIGVISSSDLAAPRPCPAQFANFRRAEAPIAQARRRYRRRARALAANHSRLAVRLKRGAAARLQHAVAPDEGTARRVVRVVARPRQRQAPARRRRRCPRTRAPIRRACAVAIACRQSAGAAPASHCGRAARAARRRPRPSFSRTRRRSAARWRRRTATCRPWSCRRRTRARR